ncbi:hypothetical protein HWV62_27723 [Athelia sp. TMB]|nr:hypothetical protein HWV62_27723 [Athelia sp. TMB]
MSQLVELPSECHLSDKSQAAVTLYTTFVITIVTTITQPYIESFILAWIAWLPVFRGAVGVGIYAVAIIPLRLESVQEARHHQRQLAQTRQMEEIPLASSRWTRLKTSLSPSLKWMNHTPPYRDAESTAGIVTLAVWAFWHFWLPFSQINWLVRHFHSATAGLMFARATGVGVGLVGMSIDYKGRVIAALGIRFGMPVAVFLSLYTILVRLALVGVMSTEYILAAIRSIHTSSSRFFIPAIVIFSLVWCAASFPFVPGRDCEAGDDENARTWSFSDIPRRSGWGFLITILTGTNDVILGNLVNLAKPSWQYFGRKLAQPRH